MHNKEQHDLTSYFKKLTHIIKNYELVLLFGPTDARVELLNLLNEDLHFSNIEIAVKHTF